MGRVIVDVGGDDAGATALGRFRASSTSRDMICSASSTSSANLFQVPMRAVGLRGNRGGVPSESDWVGQQLALGGADDCAGHSFRPSLMPRKTAEFAGLPLIYTTAPKSVAGELEGKIDNLYPVDVLS